MKVTMLLADAVQVAEGKLYILGGGWSIGGPDPIRMALAVKIDVPWDMGNTRHHFRLDLLDEDGSPVIIPTAEKAGPVSISGYFEVAQPTGLKVGTPLDAAMAYNIGPLPLTPDRRYVWRCWIDEETEEGWQVAFSTRPVPKPEGT